MDNLESIKSRISQIEKTIRDLRTTQIEGHKTLVEHTTNISVLTQLLSEIKVTTNKLERFETRANTSYDYYRESKLKYEKRLVSLEGDFDNLKTLVNDKINAITRDVDKLQEKDKGFDLLQDRIWKVITGVLTAAIAYLFFTK